MDKEITVIIKSKLALKHNTNYSLFNNQSLRGKENLKHLSLTLLSKTVSPKAPIYLRYTPPQQELTATHLGKIRVYIKEYLWKN